LKLASAHYQARFGYHEGVFFLQVSRGFLRVSKEIA
jgi:hypothetical protein